MLRLTAPRPAASRRWWIALVCACVPLAACTISPAAAPTSVSSPPPSASPSVTVSTSAASPSPAPSATHSAGTGVMVSATPLSFEQDTLADPIVTGRVAGASRVRVQAQVWANGAWTTKVSVTSAADGSYSVALSFGNGELRTDRWRIVAGAAASPDITVARTAVLNPVVHTPSRQEVQYSWRAGCPDSYTALRVIDANYYGFDGRMHRGSIVVHNTVVSQFEGLLQKLIEVRFPIRRMQPVDAYRAVDESSAAADNTSAFNCRLTTGGSQWSEHAYGVAIDINPVENPYDSNGVLVPTNGRAYLDRSNVRPGMLTSTSPVIRYALANGWAWLAPADYQHLEW